MKEAVAEQPSRGVQDEDMELRLGNRKAVRPGVLGEPADDVVDIFDVVDQGSVWMSQTIVDEATVCVALYD